MDKWHFTPSSITEFCHYVITSTPVSSPRLFPFQACGTDPSHHLLICSKELLIHHFVYRISEICEKLVPEGHQIAYLLRPKLKKKHRSLPFWDVRTCKYMVTSQGTSMNSSLCQNNLIDQLSTQRSLGWFFRTATALRKYTSTMLLSSTNLEPHFSFKLTDGGWGHEIIKPKTLKPITFLHNCVGGVG